MTFTVQATGTEPLSYQWQWKPAEEGDGSEEWRPCDEEEPKLTIPSVQKSDKGQYRCVVYNHAGRQISKPAELEVSGKLWGAKPVKKPLICDTLFFNPSDLYIGCLIYIYWMSDIYIGCLIYILDV